MAVFLDRAFEGQNDALSGWIVGHAGEIFGQCFAGDCQAIAVQQAMCQQTFHQRLYAADGYELGHQVFAAGPHIGQHWHALADTREVGQRQLDARFMCDGQQMQYGIGGAPQCNDHGDGVLERFTRQDVAGTDAKAQQVNHCSAGSAAVFVLVAADGLLRRTVGQA